MISLRDLKSNPPAELTPLVPYQDGAPPLVDTAVLQEWCEGQVTAAGLLPEEVTTAIVLGCQGGALIQHLSELCPNLAQLQVLEPDVRMVRTLVTTPFQFAGKLALEHCHLADVINPGEGYSLNGYIDMASFHVAYQVRPSRTLVVPDPTLQARSESQYWSLAAPLHDITHHSSELLHQLWQTEQLKSVLADPAHPAEDWLFLSWANYLFEQGEHYHALKFLLAYTGLCDEAQLPLRVAQCWQRLDCPDQARLWYDRAEGAGKADKTAVARQCEHAAKKRKRTYDANLAQLKTDFPAVAQALQSQQRPELESVVVSDRPWQLMMNDEQRPFIRSDTRMVVRVDGERLHEVTTITSPRAMHTQLKGVDDTKNAHVCVGTASTEGGLYNARSNTLTSPIPNWTQSVYLMEKDVGALRINMEHYDYRGLLKPESLSFFVGEDAEDQLLNLFLNNPNLPVPKVCTDISEEFAERLDNVGQQRRTEAVQGLQELHRIYHPGFPEELLEVLSTGSRPLRIWFWTSIHTTVLQYVSQDLARGFEDLGHDVSVLVEKEANEAIDISSMTRHLTEFQPDVVILLDHVRTEYGHLFPPSLPVVTWILDELPHLRREDFISKLTGLDVALVPVIPLRSVYRKLNYPVVEHVPFAVNTHTYFSKPDTKVKDSVAYATHLTFPNSPACDRGFMKWLEPRVMAMEDLPLGREGAVKIADDAIAERGLSVPDSQMEDLYYQTMMMVRHVERTRPAEAMLEAGIPMELFGRGWADIPRFRKYARGVVKPGEPLRSVYQGHKVVLHIARNFNLHPRVFETLGSGGLMLARSDGERFDYFPGEIATYFDVGRELCLFKDSADMVAQIRRAFEDDVWREGIVRAGQARVNKSHSYKQRAAQVLDILRGQLRVHRRSVDVAA